MSTDQSPRAGDGKAMEVPYALPGSFAGAAKTLASDLEALSVKCRPGYQVSKGVRDKIADCLAIASALVYALDMAHLAAAPAVSAPAGYRLLEDGKTMIPEDWVPLRLEWEPGYPEDAAFGPARLMERLKKWLDAHFETRRIAQYRASLPVVEAGAIGAPAEKVGNLGPRLFAFATFSHWVNHAQSSWKGAGVRVENTLCIDAKGRHCFIGRDFMIARDDGAFPVTVHLRRADLAEELGFAPAVQAPATADPAEGSQP